MKRSEITIAIAIASVACGGAAMPGSEAAPVQVAPEATHTQDTTPRIDVAGARSDFDRAEQGVASALEGQLRAGQQHRDDGDCAVACRALASMERAADHLCALDSGTQCELVRERVVAARERIRTTCGACSP